MPCTWAIQACRENLSDINRMSKVRQNFLDRMYEIRRLGYRDKKIDPADDKCSGLSSDSEIFKDQANRELEDMCGHEK